MGVEYSNKITVLGVNNQIERFINNEKHSEYLRKYKQKIERHEYGTEFIEFEVDDHSQPIEEYEIKNNEFIHYSSTWKHNPVEWLIEISNRYHELYFKLDSRGDDGYGFKIELKKGEEKLFIEQESKEHKNFIKEDGTPYYVDIWNDIIPSLEMNPKKEVLVKLKRRLRMIKYSFLSFFIIKKDIDELD